MKRYYFNIRDGFREIDGEGSLFKTVDDAYSEAVKYAGELIQNEPALLNDGHDLCVDVVDEDDICLWTVKISTMRQRPPIADR